MNIKKTADEMTASVDATLASWRSAFESSSTPANNSKADCEGDGGSIATTPNKKSTTQMILWKDSDACHRRLCTFKTETYFAKPLELSPLVCAAFGWENTEKDIIQCNHCQGTICVAFHPSLNEESRANLSQKYLDMLVTCHNTTCPFRSYASRWSRIMHQSSCGSSTTTGGEDGDKSSVKQVGGAIKTNFENDPTNNTMKYKVSDALGNSSKNKFYVPPYLLSLSDEYLRFEDCSTDGSITRDRVNEGALQIRDKLQAMENDIGKNFNDIVGVTIPEVATKFCHEKHASVDLAGVFCQKESIMKVPYLLSTFGWSVCEEPQDEEEKIGMLVVKCNMCQARAICMTGQPSVSDKEDERCSRKKRRRITHSQAANLKLIDSHRTYCPYVSGFSNGYGNQSHLPGWKVVISKLLDSADTRVPARAK